MNRREEYVSDMPIIEAQELSLNEKERAKLLQLAEQASMYGRAAREARKEHEKATGAMKELIGKADPGRCKIMAGPIPLTYYSTERRTLKPELLLDNGVTPLIINKCTVVSTSWTLKVGDEE